MTSSAPQTVRDVFFDILRQYELTTVFANPGSTEISLLANLPADIDFTLALHEGSVVGMATGYALARRKAAMVVVHTTAGLGNAVGAIATARVNRAPLVIVVGQQDRRHLATEPFLAGRLRGLVGEYPVWFNEPVTPLDVPAAVARAYHEATTRRGPAIVIVPMDDWLAEYTEERVFPAPASAIVSGEPSAATVATVVGHLDSAKNPVIIAGAGNDTDEGWAALVRLAERTQTPVYQESFAGRAGFPQDHPLFAGFLSAARSVLRKQLADFDTVLAVGAPVFRQYNYEPGLMVTPGTAVIVVTNDSDEALRSAATLSVIGDIPATISEVADTVRAVSKARTAVPPRRTPPPAPTGDEPLRASHVMAALAELLPADTIVVEETPSSRPDMHDLLPARQPLGFVSAAMGGLGFGLPATIGLRMGLPSRPTVAILGDGSSMYSIQGLWSARHYKVGALFIILNNGRYAVMDRLAEKSGSAEPAWPPFDEIDFVDLSQSLGVEATRLSDYATMRRTLEEMVPTLATRNDPHVLVIDVEPEQHFAP
jgi:benzoylformate decarboxylase